MTDELSGDHPAEEPEEIIDDLETLKSLLAEETPTPAEAVVVDDIPMLDDTIEPPPAESPLDDETFATLLSDTWRDSFEGMFAEARGEIERNSTAWAPADTDDLTAALKVRIDASVRDWLAETLAANVSLLRERVISELSAEILDHLHNKISPPPTLEDIDPDHGK